MIKMWFIGNVVFDPRMGTTASGKQVCNFVVAASPTRKGRDGERKTEFVRVTAWEKLAEICAQNLFKGRRVAVATSDVQTSAYQRKTTGEWEGQMEVTAEDVEFMFSREGDTPQEAYRMQESQQQRREAVQKPQPAQPEGFISVDDDDLPFEFGGERR